MSAISPERAAGRSTNRSNTRPEREARHGRAGQREPRVRVEELDERQREQPADDREFALREVDDPGRPQDDVDAQGHERVAAPDG